MKEELSHHGRPCVCLYSLTVGGSNVEDTVEVDYTLIQVIYDQFLFYCSKVSF